MTTIKEIARLSGVSRGTVDRVLNNRDGVSEETAERVRAIAKQLGYKPNKAGMALAAQKKKYRIGIIVFSRKNPFFDKVIEGFLEKADELAFFGCEVTVKRVAYHPAAQLSAIEACLDEGVQGIIITPYNDAKVCEKLNGLIADGIPVITVNSDAENVNRIAYVGSDYLNSGSAAGALMQLMTHDKVNIGIILGDRNILCHSQREAGFKDRLSEDSRFNIISVEENYDDDLKSYDIVSDMLRNHPEINGLYFTAAGVYGGCKAIQEIGVGRDIRVITHDDVPTTVDMLDKGIITATICQEPMWQGSRSLELMFNYLSNPEQTQVKNYYYAQLNIKIRETK
ncbi:MAG: LacI family DNA-binding transcriptional regulator [Lachnospiraceae bacterium]|nr:LacI family DNA-binding transcriptional regulator [Lachnospiraceae bacterium]